MHIITITIACSILICIVSQVLQPGVSEAVFLFFAASKIQGWVVVNTTADDINPALPRGP